MKPWKEGKLISLSIALALLGTACGGSQAYVPPTPQGTGTNGTNNAFNGDPGSNPGSNITANASTDSSAGSPAITKSFTIQGNEFSNKPPTPTFYPNYPDNVKMEGISTDSILKVTLTGSPTLRAQYADSGYSKGYAGSQIYTQCLQVNIKLIDHDTGLQVGSDQTVSVSTVSTKTNIKCGDQAPHPNADFSGSLTSGHGPIDLVISQANVDVYYNSSMGGTVWMHQLGPLYYTYVAQGSLIIHTNKTQ